MEARDTIILVTGGAHGIGRALVERFHAEGAKGIAVVDLDLDAARAVAEKVGGLALEADVSQEAAIRRAVDRTEEQLGPIDLLCSNAGVLFSDRPGWMATSQTNDQWETTWKVNVMAHVWAARAVLPSMIRRGKGYLLHTVSAAGLLHQIGDAAYSTSKHAAVGFAESLAITHGDQGIGVSILCPQAVDTRMFAQAGGTGKNDDSGGGTSDDDPGRAAAAAASADGVLTPAQVAEAAIQGLRDETFLVLPHPGVAQYMRNKAQDYDRWLRGMRRFRRSLFPDDGIMDLGPGPGGGRPGNPPPAS